MKLLLPVLFTALSFLPACLSAQVSDSLYNALTPGQRPADKRVLTDTERMKIVGRIDGVVFNNNKKEVLGIVEDAKSISAKAGKLLKAKYTLALADFYAMLPDYDTSFIYFKKTQEYAGEDKALDYEYSRAGAQLASFYTMYGEQDTAIEYLNRAIVRGNNKDTLFLKDVYSAYENIYDAVGLFEKSIEYSRKSLALLRPDEKWGVSYTFNQLFMPKKFNELYHETKLKRYTDSAEHYLALIRNAIERNPKKMERWYAAYYYSAGQTKYEAGAYKEAVKFYDSCMMPEFLEKNRDIGGIFRRGRLERLICLVALDDAAAAKTLDSLDLTEKTDLWDNMFKNLFLYKYAKRHGQWEKALTYHEQYKICTDTLDLIKARSRVFEVNQKYSVAKKEVEIKTLENKNLKEKDIKTKITGGSVLAVMALLLVIMISYSNNKKLQVKREKEKQQLISSLQAMEQEMEQERLEQQLEKAAAVAGQRKTISQDLHDEISSGLAALRYYIADIKSSYTDPAVKDKLNDIELETEALYIQARNFMHELQKNNTGVGHYNVVSLVRHLTSRFNNKLVLHINTNINENEIEKKFTPQQHYEMYLVIKEAITNVIKHANATQVALNIHVENNTCNFSISDNGRGFDVHKEKNRGIGLLSITDRVRNLGGTLDIVSKNTGTILKGSFSLI